VYDIPKRDGGHRTIAQPSRELKSIQRFIMANCLHSLPVHPAATAYVRGTSIRDNATAHSKNNVILKLDFSSFSPSIKVKDWLYYTEAVGEKWCWYKYARQLAFVMFWGGGRGVAEIIVGWGADVADGI